MPKASRLDERAKPVLERLRRICMKLPGTAESLTFGNPTFKAAGKAYAVLDRYKGKTCI